MQLNVLAQEDLAYTLDKYLDLIKNNKIYCFVVGLSTCTTCNDWIPNILEPELKKHNIPYSIVHSDLEQILFPPPYAPTTYFYIEKYPNMPMIISGPVSKEELLEDLEMLFKEVSV